MSDDPNVTLKAHLARQCAVGREKFGPGERSKGVIDHITKEFDEIAHAENAQERAQEWTDVAILALDGLCRAVREQLREAFAGQKGVQVHNEVVIGHNGEPTNDFVATVAARMITQKQQKNELRDFGDWRGRSEDEAIEHKRGVHD